MFHVMATWLAFPVKSLLTIWRRGRHISDKSIEPSVLSLEFVDDTVGEMFCQSKCCTRGHECLTDYNMIGVKWTINNCTPGNAKCRL